MKISTIFITLIILTLIPFSYAANDFAFNRLYDGSQPIDGFNYSINVNHSTFTDSWITNIGLLTGVNSTQHTNIGGLLNIDTAWLSLFIEIVGNELYCKLTGCTMTGDIIFNNAGIQNPDYIVMQGEIDMNGNDILMESGNIISVENITLINSIKDSDSPSRVYFDDDGVFVVEG